MLSSSSTPVTTSCNASTLIPNPADIGLTRITVIALCSVTAIFLFLICCMAFIYYFGFGTRHTLDSRTSAVFIFLAALVATVAGVSGTSSSIDVYRIYVLAICLLVGLLFTLSGAYFFFDNRPMCYGADAKLKSKEIGHKHDNMGIVIWLITLPLIAMEFSILLGNLRKEQDIFYSGDYIVAVLQKLAQAATYYFSLRHRYYYAKLPFTTHWYFVVMALFNFIMWEDSILTARMDDDYSRYLYGRGFSIFKATYNSLIIDYRLMCCLLFAEHAMEINKEIEKIKQCADEELLVSSIREPSNGDILEVNRPHSKPRWISQESNQVIHSSSAFDVQVSHYTGAGYIFGLIIFALQSINGLQYLGFVGSWSCLLPMAAHVSMFILGIIFLRVNNLTSVFGNWKETDTRAIDAMVGIIGGVGFTFMIIRTLMTASLAKYYRKVIAPTYLAMSAAKNCFNALGLLFQFYIFMRVSFDICSHPPNNKKVINHFLVPALTLMQLSIFITAVIDEYNGIIEELLALAKLNPAIVFFLDIGSPMYLGFCLHMFLHFLIIRRNMRTKKARAAYLLDDASIESLDDDVTPDAIRGSRELTNRNNEEIEQPLMAS